LAALKLVEQGKITFDTPVSDYLPQFRNPIIVEKTDTQETNFRPAETVMTLRHLLTMTSGLFYPTASETGLPKGYSSKEMHHSEDPISEFFRVITVRSFFFLANLKHENMLNYPSRENFPPYP
jgi:CubicO group peptidase (beta-lactamase class C family)